ncbi:hypothetical protein J6590_018869 [Homalodisca vitripennis]|nr:hypothetical protein J6590_018869 [Homalodisca vitripennis]
MTCFKRQPISRMYTKFVRERNSRVALRGGVIAALTSTSRGRSSVSEASQRLFTALSVPIYSLTRVRRTISVIRTRPCSPAYRPALVTIRSTDLAITTAAGPRRAQCLLDYN